MSAPVTQWFKEAPAKVGIWEVKTEDDMFSDLRWFSYWNGEDWRYLFNDPAGAYEYRAQGTTCVILKFRGVANEPKEE